MHVVKTIKSLEGSLEKECNVTLSGCKDFVRLNVIKNYFEDNGYLCNLEQETFIDKGALVYKITINKQRSMA